MSESSFICPGLQASGLTRRLQGKPFTFAQVKLFFPEFIWNTAHFMLNNNQSINKYIYKGGCHDCYRIVVGFTTTYAISAYHHWCYEFESRSGRGVQHYVIKFISDLQQVSSFLRVLRFPPPTDRHDIT